MARLALLALLLAFYPACYKRPREATPQYSYENQLSSERDPKEVALNAKPPPPPRPVFDERRKPDNPLTPEEIAKLKHICATWYEEYKAAPAPPPAVARYEPLTLEDHGSTAAPSPAAVPPPVPEPEPEREPPPPPTPIQWAEAHCQVRTPPSESYVECNPVCIEQTIRHCSEFHACKGKRLYAGILEDANREYCLSQRGSRSRVAREIIGRGLSSRVARTRGDRVRRAEGLGSWEHGPKPEFCREIE